MNTITCVAEEKIQKDKMTVAVWLPHKVAQAYFEIANAQGPRGKSLAGIVAVLLLAGLRSDELASFLSIVGSAQATKQWDDLIQRAKDGEFRRLIDPVPLHSKENAGSSNPSDDTGDPKGKKFKLGNEKPTGILKRIAASHRSGPQPPKR